MADWDETSDEQLRYGGPQAAEADGEGGNESEVQRKAKERELKKAEVRKRLEEAGKAGKKKKGFLTPERKKKLRKLLMMKAAENLKSAGLKSQQERQSALQSRLPPLPDVDNINDKGQLEKIYNDLFSKMVKLEEEKFDVNYVVSSKDAEINELSIAVNDLRGKFVKPTLKKVSKYDNKFKKLAESSSEKKETKEDFRAKLKVVKKENVIDETIAKTKKADKPEWSKKAKGEAGDVPPSPTKTSKPAKTEETPEEEEPEDDGGEEEEEEDEEEEE